MQTPTTKTIIFRITLVIGLVELAIMLVLGDISYAMSPSLEALLDTLMLVSLSTPVIYLWIIKPYVVARDEAVEQVTYMAFHDPLTQLANRRLLSAYLEKVLSRIGRHKLYGALILIDLDGFKPINDNNGHATGDAILVEMANRLQTCVRGDDIASRLGGDEFVVLVSDLDNDKDMARQRTIQVATRIQEIINQPIKLRKTFQLGASIGIRMLLDENATIDSLLKEADIAMYRAKQAGKGCTVVFE